MGSNVMVQSILGIDIAIIVVMMFIVLIVLTAVVAMVVAVKLGNLYISDEEEAFARKDSKDLEAM